MIFKYVKEENPSLYNKWISHNENIPQLFNTFEKFAYSLQYEKGKDYNTILDPRSYYIFHSFFEKNQNIKLPMTWLMNTKQDIERYPAVAQPFNVNNIDLSVLCNFLFGVTSHTIHFNNFNLLNQHPILEQMLLNASEIIKFGLENEIELNRPDLSLVYYPSVYDFYWFISRTSYLLRNSNIFSNIILQKVSNNLYTCLMNQVTNNIIKLAQQDGQQYYWDDFLGDFPKKKLGEDRLFSTSLALSALLDTWTDEITPNNIIGKRRWNPQTPSKVHSLIQGGILYLQENLFAWFASHENAFFSGSVKGSNDYPFWYPLNYAQYLNGTKIKPVNQDDITSELCVGVEGVIDSSEYSQMLKQEWFNMSVPTSFKGFAEESFPFWSSPALTYSMAQLVFSKFINLI